LRNCHGISDGDTTPVLASFIITNWHVKSDKSLSLLSHANYMYIWERTVAVEKNLCPDFDSFTSLAPDYESVVFGMPFIYLSVRTDLVRAPR
jgi:hypothetical protein